MKWQSYIAKVKYLNSVDPLFLLSLLCSFYPYNTP